MQTENYIAKATKQSAWGTLGFLINTGASLIIAISITRYFGKELYGQYSYFIWFATIISILAGFGLNQAITKYLPRYFFGENQEGKAQKLLRKFLIFQIIFGFIAASALFLLANPIQSLINFDPTFKQNLFGIALVTVIPLALNTLLISTISAIQEFKKLSIIQSSAGIINLIAIGTLIILKQDIIAFLWLFLAFNLLLLGSYLAVLIKLLRKPQQPEKLPSKEIFSYCAWNYLGTFFGQIAWERSEIFFLGLFTNSSQIALYALAYSLTVLIIGAFGPINTVLNNLTAEVIGTNKPEKFFNISHHASKYLAILMLPVIIYASFLMGNLVELLFGKGFSEVAFFFPLLISVQAFAIIITPASNIAYFNQEVKKMTLITVFTGILNLLLDFLLIPRFQAFGAVLANVIAQIFSIILVLINAKKYRLGLLNNLMLRVWLINGLLAITLFTITQLNSNLFLKIAITLGSIIFYSWAILKFAFNYKDLELLKNLKSILPKSLRAPFHFLLQKAAPWSNKKS